MIVGPQIEMGIERNLLSTQEAINEHLKEYQSEILDWPLNRMVTTLHKWVEIFNLEFKLQLPTPVINFEKCASRILGQFQVGRSGIGTKDTITMNLLYIDRSPENLLVTLLHEMLHSWQQAYGVMSRSVWYHNKQFRDKAAECGLLVSEEGCSLGYSKICNDVLDRNREELRYLQLPENTNPVKVISSGSKMKKWSCRCPVPVNVRCAVTLDATCNKCHNRFELNGE